VAPPSAIRRSRNRAISGAGDTLHRPAGQATGQKPEPSYEQVWTYALVFPHVVGGVCPHG
ncbi:hypothetical protein, partial [Acetobacter okinawensis]|uniref:hypothetical protein n=1 Tax=Acetobacter okinawensis TaxID=1076594 RepID=UPI001BA98237